MLPEAPFGPAEAAPHTLPSGLMQPAGSAAAKGAAATAAAAAPVRKTVVKEIFVSAMCHIYLN
jgi:hypothetical protein